MQHVLKKLIIFFVVGGIHLTVLKCEADQSSPSSIVFKNEWGYTITPTYDFWGVQEKPYFSVTL